MKTFRKVHSKNATLIPLLITLFSLRKPWFPILREWRYARRCERVSSYLQRYVTARPWLDLDVIGDPDYVVPRLVLDYHRLDAYDRLRVSKEISHFLASIRRRRYVYWHNPSKFHFFMSHFLPLLQRVESMQAVVGIVESPDSSPGV